MAVGKSTTSDDEGELGADIVAKLRRHEALTREIYGCSLDDLLALASGRGLREGYAAGYKRGRTDRSRAAKGVETSHKLTAKTLIMLLELSSHEDVPRVLKASRPGRWPLDWPRLSTLRREYFRQRDEKKRAAAADSALNIERAGWSP